MKPQRQAEKRLMGDDPLAADSILERFYKPVPEPIAVNDVPAAVKAKEKPTHYKVVCISLYNEDIARLESLVAELKRRGFSKANKSQLIRFALDTVDLDKMPKAY